MPQKKNKVLFLDDDRSFLEVLKSLMASYARDAWEIFAASDTGQALGIIQEQQLDLLVVDVHMPVVDGLQFLSLIQRKYPNILKVVLTGDASEHYRAACLSNGAELFLQKPATAQGWQSVYSTLNELMRFQPEEGFRGVRTDCYRVELDRRRAIDEIVREARAGDVVLIAGKGHETYQEFEDTVVPFDDRIYAQETLEALGFRPKRKGAHA